MNFKKIVTWSLTGLVGLLFIASALGKFTALEKSEMALHGPAGSFVVMVRVTEPKAISAAEGV